MFSKYLGSIDGVSIYAIVGLILFVTMFLGVAVWALRADKKYIGKMKNLPLENDTENNKELINDKL